MGGRIEDAPARAEAGEEDPPCLDLRLAPVVLGDAAAISGYLGSPKRPRNMINGGQV